MDSKIEKYKRPLHLCELAGNDGNLILVLAPDAQLQALPSTGAYMHPVIRFVAGPSNTCTFAYSLDASLTCYFASMMALEVIGGVQNVRRLRRWGGSTATKHHQCLVTSNERKSQHFA
jgi:hypothetical protein